MPFLPNFALFCPFYRTHAPTILSTLDSRLLTFDFRPLTLDLRLKLNRVSGPQGTLSATLKK